ncbi:hypothetical protein RclHR1_12620006 [Rhizophagus clarus]|uniref:Uncharacterized protein n=1 Tax=Rhizophagus clarus TaxID=94130 RepID=A0A2Z6QK64_9GLOM|nr:hypothetical protein RclHR1_12620006 [Rhizophagus clarus]
MNDAGLGEEGGIILLETFLNSKNKNLETLSLASVIKNTLKLKILELNGNYSVSNNCISKLKLTFNKNETFVEGLDDLVEEENEAEAEENKEEGYNRKDGGKEKEEEEEKGGKEDEGEKGGREDEGGEGEGMEERKRW